MPASEAASEITLTSWHVAPDTMDAATQDPFVVMKPFGFALESVFVLPERTDYETARTWSF